MSPYNVITSTTSLLK